MTDHELIEALRQNAAIHEAEMQRHAEEVAIHETERDRHAAEAKRWAAALALALGEPQPMPEDLVPVKAVPTAGARPLDLVAAMIANAGGAAVSRDVVLATLQSSDFPFTDRGRGGRDGAIARIASQSLNRLQKKKQIHLTRDGYVATRALLQRSNGAAAV